MTNEKLLERIENLERRVGTLERGHTRRSGRKDPRSTFGMFADDPHLDAVLEFGREYRRKVNAGEPIEDDESE